MRLFWMTWRLLDRNSWGIERLVVENQLHCRHFCVTLHSSAGTSHRSQVFCACAAATCAMAKAAHCLKGPVRWHYMDWLTQRPNRPSNSHEDTQKIRKKKIHEQLNMERRQESNKAIRQTICSPFFREENCVNLLYLAVVWVLCNNTKRFVTVCVLKSCSSFCVWIQLVCHRA